MSGNFLAPDCGWGEQEFCQDVPAVPPPLAWPGLGVGGASLYPDPCLLSKVSCPLTLAHSLFSSPRVGGRAGVTWPRALEHCIDQKSLSSKNRILVWEREFDPEAAAQFPMAPESPPKREPLEKCDTGWLQPSPAREPPVPGSLCYRHQDGQGTLGRRAGAEPAAGRHCTLNSFTGSHSLRNSTSLLQPLVCCDSKPSSKERAISGADGDIPDSFSHPCGADNH